MSLDVKTMVGIGMTGALFGASICQFLNKGNKEVKKDPETPIREKSSQDLVNVIGQDIIKSAEQNNKRITNDNLNQELKKLFEKCKQYDKYNNCNIDISTTDLSFKECPDFFTQCLSSIIAEEKIKKTHVVTIKLSHKHSDMFRGILESGFIFNQANAQFALLSLCLSNHQVKECTFPKFRTVSIGVTGVVFDEKLEKVLLVQEKFGVQKLKPPTGTVEYGEENTELPIQTVVREIAEETGVKVSAENAHLIGTTWSNTFRGNNPDINYAYAFKVSQETSIKAQESEIASVQWVDVDQFLQPSADEIEKKKPWIMRNIVKAAHVALKNDTVMKSEEFYYSFGKPVTFHSSKVMAKI